MVQPVIVVRQDTTLEEAARLMLDHDIMTSHVITVTENDIVEHVVELMRHHHIHRLPVVRDDVPVGMVT